MLSDDFIFHLSLLKGAPLRKLNASGTTEERMSMNVRQIEQRYALAKEQYAALGVDADAACVTNIWILDGSKDMPVDRKSLRERLMAASGNMLRKINLLS